MMNTAHARSAYAPAQPMTRSERGIEYQAFAAATRRLRKILDTDQIPVSELAEALYQNQKLWITLASDVASDANALSDQLKAQILYLAQFTQEHSRKALKREVDVSALVDINTSVMRGLRGAQVAA